MPTPEQYQRRAQQTTGYQEPPINQGVWRWQGFAGGGRGKITNGTVEVIAPIQGNAMPAINQVVQYQVGSPGVIVLPTANQVAVGTGATPQRHIDDLNGYIEATADKTYPLIANSTHAYTVVALNTGGTSAATVATSPAVGASIAVGGTLGLVVSSSDGNDLSFTVRLARV